MNANRLQVMMAWLLTGTMALSAAGSFRRERDTGVLELLLVSPLGENQIISGRLGGLWGQFLPAAGLLLSVWAYLSTFLPNGSDVGVVLFFLRQFLTVPVFGLYFSLRCRNFITAFLATVAMGLLLPLVLPRAAAVVVDSLQLRARISLGTAAVFVGGSLPGGPRRGLLGPAPCPAEESGVSSGTD